MKLFPQCLLLLLLLPVSAQSATLRVPSEYLTIQAALDHTAEGDTVLVAPGVYSVTDTRPNSLGDLHSAIAFVERGVTLLSESGPDATVLRLVSAEEDPYVVYGHIGMDANVVVSGFTIASTLPECRGIDIRGSPLLVVENCLFRDVNPGVGSFRQHVEVRSSVFEGLPGGPWSGAAIYHAQARIRIEDCDFVSCGRTPVRISGHDSPPNWLTDVEIRDSRFLRNVEPSSGPSACSAYATSRVVVEDCWFEGNEGFNAGALGCSGDSVRAVSNVFWRNHSYIGEGGASIRATFVGEVRNNSFVANSQSLFDGAAVQVTAAQNGVMVFRQNVVVGHEGGVAVVGNTEVVSGCNLFWDNEGGDVVGFFDPLDFSVDPQLCGSGRGDFTVAASSPCLPENMLFDCGPIGAFGAGCPDLGTVFSAVTTTPIGLPIEVDRIPAPSVAGMNWLPGTDHTLAVPEVYDRLGRRYEFASWGDGTDAPVRTVVAPAEPTLYSATYDSLFGLSVSAAAPEGTVSPGGYQIPFSTVQISAEPDSGFFFKWWTGTGDGAYTGPDSVATVTMNSPISEVAYFSTLTEVTISSDPEGLTLTADDEEFVTPKTFIWERDTGHFFSTPEVHHEEGSGIRYLFVVWSDGETSPYNYIEVGEEPVTVSALFDTEYELTFEPTIHGELTPGDGWREPGSIVEIEATPDPYYLFTGWTGTGPGSYTGPDNPATVTMDGPVHEEAHFRRMAQEVTLSLSASDPFVHTGPPVGFGNVYLWYVCATDGGFSGLDAQLAGTMTPLAFLPEPGIFNGGDDVLLEITATECQEGPTLLGSVLVQDEAGGELSLVPRSDSGVLHTLDCSTPTALPFEWPLDLKITNVRTDGGAAESSGRGCEEAPTAVQDVPQGQQAVPSALSLSAPRPNPLQGGGRSRFEFALPGPATVRLAVYDVTGRQVAARRPEVYPSGGAYSIDWDPGLHSSGVYYVRLTTDTGQAVGTRWVVVR